MRCFGLFLVAVLAATCGGGIAPADDPNMRGDTGTGGDGAGIDAGSAGGSGGHASAAGGANGAGGALAAAGGRAGSGGMTGAGGATASYLPCVVYDWHPTGEGGCSKLISVGIYQIGYKDGHLCKVCNSPTRPAGAPECTFGSGDDLCVLSCSECVFQ